jgi:recombination protein RecA
MDLQERQRNLSATLSQIEKQFGKGSVLRLGSKESVVPVSSISTGAISVDYALGVGGFPRGRINEIFGPESSGKTTIALQVVAQAQANGGMAAVRGRGACAGPDLCAEARCRRRQPAGIAAGLCRTGAGNHERSDQLGVGGRLVVDSVAALVPKAELDGEMGDQFVGVQARLMSQAMRKLTGIVAKSNTCLIFINQIREKIGVMFGSPETTSGGRALKFYSSVRADIRRIAAIKDGDVVIGNRTKGQDREEQGGAAVPRGGIRHPLREGVSREGDLIDLGRGSQRRREERLLVQLQDRANRARP